MRAFVSRARHSTDRRGREAVRSACAARDVLPTGADGKPFVLRVRRATFYRPARVSARSLRVRGVRRSTDRRMYEVAHSACAAGSVLPTDACERTFAPRARRAALYRPACVSAYSFRVRGERRSTDWCGREAVRSACAPGNVLPTGACECAFAPRARRAALYRSAHVRGRSFRVCGGQCSTDRRVRAHIRSACAAGRLIRPARAGRPVPFRACAAISSTLRIRACGREPLPRSAGNG